MRKKLFKAIKRFIELFTPGGTEYTRSGFSMVYSRTGGISMPEEEREKYLFHYLDKVRRERALRGEEVDGEEPGPPANSAFLFNLIIRADDIVTATPFSEAIYTEFNPGWRQRIADQAHRAQGGGDQPTSANDPDFPRYALSSMGTNFTFSGPT